MTRWIALALLSCGAALGARKIKKVEVSPLDRYIQEAEARQTAAATATPGSAFSPSSLFSDLAGDVRAARVDDIVNILVAERASAVSTGAVKTSRQSDVNSSVTAAGGLTRAAGPWANLAGASTTTKLDGSGTTSRDTNLSTTLSARVTHVLPNGYLVVEGIKDLEVNSERQRITVRGMVRPLDLSPGNQVRSDHLAQLEVRINAKGVVNDAVRRPNFLYRVLLGLMPF
jgi:flagellar L-ring protein precursor FlgH